ncbi:MAG: helix-turn-helix domain-containing protein [Corallococcus sp.]|nr:helix-turn-helix domain-containing protein [Corallococcus sp.]
MANRRMFSVDVTETDDFLELSHSAQMLYLHLCQHADDDGFINNYRSIVRNTRCEQKHLDELITNGFLLSFGKGNPVVVRDWLVSNQIRPSRRKDTLYTNEKRLLLIEKGKPYSFLVGNNLADKNADLSAKNANLSPQYSLDEFNPVKISQGESFIAENPLKQNTQNTFIPPTFEEVENYCKEINSAVDPARFFYYYEKENWQGVKNWKSLLRYWGTYEQGKGKTKTEPPESWIDELAKI